MAKKHSQLVAILGLESRSHSSSLDVQLVLSLAIQPHSASPLPFEITNL